jgi:ligand-binding sensor domain-containing protein
MYMICKIFIFCLMFPLSLYPQPRDIRFERITVEDDLTDVTVHDILQDQQGFMWFGTWNGVSKYDGYTFTTYRHDPDVPSECYPPTGLAHIEIPGDTEPRIPLEESQVTRSYTFGDFTLSLQWDQ